MADERRWIGNGYGWDEMARTVTEHRCSRCTVNLDRVGPASRSGAAFLECPSCGVTAHLVPS